MKTVHRTLLGIAIVQAISTLIGFVELLFWPQFFKPMLDRTVFAGQYALAAVLLGVVVGGTQWVAVWAHVARPRRAALADAVAGTVMLGWIAGEALAMNMFIWPHALWGGLGALQLVLTLVWLGVLRPLPVVGAAAR